MSDTQKVVDFVTAALTPHLNTQVPFVFVHQQTAFQSCKFTNIRKARFVEEVADALTSFDVVRDVGTWVYTEFGDGFGMFVRVLNVAEAKGLIGAASVIDLLNKKPGGVGLIFGADALVRSELADAASFAADGDTQGEDWK